MFRNEGTTIQRLLSAIHSTKEPRELAPAWQNEVMTEIARTGRHDTGTAALERLAPRFALAALAMSVIALTTGAWTLADLPGEMFTAYANTIYTPTILGL